MPVASTVSASSADPLPENVGELLAAFDKGEPESVEAVTESTASPENPPESPTPESAPEKAEPAWRKVLAEVPEDELFQDPKLSGRLGRLVQKQVEKQLKDTTAQQAREQKQRQEDELLARSPQQYGQMKQAERVQAQNLAALYEQVYTPLRQHWAELEPEVQKELADKSYAHLSPADSAVAYMRDAFEKAVEVRTKKAVATAVKDAREAERKKVLGELNGTSPRPDTGASAATPRRSNTPASVERMPTGDYRALGKTPAERVAAVLGSHVRSA